MLELDFLPAWYPKLRRRRRALVLQVYCMIAVAAGLGIWIAHIHRSLRTAQADDAALAQEICTTRKQLGEMDRLTLLRKRLSDEDQVFAQLGTHVDAARMIRAIDQAMPREVALLGLQMNVQDAANAPAPATRPTAATTAPAPATQPVGRRLCITLQGVAPTAASVAAFKAQLGSVPYFDAVAVKEEQERADAGHALRTFAVSFTVNLDAQPGP